MDHFRASPEPPSTNVRFQPASETALGAVDKVTDDAEARVESNNGLPEAGTDNGAEDGAAALTSKIAKMRRLGRRTKEKTRTLLSMDGETSLDSEEEALHHVARQVHEDPAFNPAQMVAGDPPRVEGQQPSPKKALKSVASAIIHPRDTIKDKMTRTAAGKLSGAQRPYLSPEADREFLQAHDNLSQLASRGGSRQVSENDTDETEDQAREKVEKLESHRRSLKVGWTTGRHVDRVRVVQNMLPPFPDHEYFVERDGANNYVRYQWEKFIGYVLLYHSRRFTAQYIDDFNDLPFDVDTLARTVERLVMASAPWQAWYMSVRKVYRWEDPVLTGRWLLLSIVLWYTEHIYAYVIYAVIKERYRPGSVDAIRESLDRVLNRGAKAYQWGDLVDQHGRDKWLDPLLDELGPYLQLQLGDLADLAEVLSHFYYWSAPNRTAYSLFFVFCCLLVTLLSDMRFCVKIVWFIAMGSFFLCWPISSRYPKYRYLLDPLKWVLWDIPTNAEWSLEHLRQKAHLQQQEIDGGARGLQGTRDQAERQSGLERFPRSRNVEDGIAEANSASEVFVTPPSSPTLAPTKGLFGFPAVSHAHAGRFLVDRDGVRFHRHSTGTDWKVFYSRLVEMRKARTPKKPRVASLSPGTGRIELYFRTEQGSERVEEVDIKDGKRDEVFNVIVGWSGLRWRALQLSRAAVKGDGQRHLGR